MARPPGMTLRSPELLRAVMAGQHNFSSLARATGLSRSYLVMISNGTRPTCSAAAAESIASALKVRTTDLFSAAVAEDSAAKEGRGE